MFRRILVAAAMAGLPAAIPATAGASPLRHDYLHLYRQVRSQFGTRTPGRNIVRHGMPSGRRAPDRRVRESMVILRRMLAPSPAPAPVAITSSYTPPATTSSSAAPSYTSTPAPSSSGTCGPGYRGLYQFDCQTWQSVGGTGDPAQASVEEQTRRAEMLQSQRGNAPWPVCGQGGASLSQIAQCESGGDPHAIG